MRVQHDGYVIAGIVALSCVSIGSATLWGQFASAFMACGLLAYLLLHEG